MKLIKTYTVKEGDTLWSISEKAFGNPHKWKKIYYWNSKVIGDSPDLIKSGQVLEIPRYRTNFSCIKRHTCNLEQKVSAGNESYLNQLFFYQDILISYRTMRVFIFLVLLMLAMMLLK